MIASRLREALKLEMSCPWNFSEISVSAVGFGGGAELLLG
jgi:hypothetical protein